LAGSEVLLSHLCKPDIILIQKLSRNFRAIFVAILALAGGRTEQRPV